MNLHHNQHQLLLLTITFVQDILEMYLVVVGILGIGVYVRCRCYRRDNLQIEGKYDDNIAVPAHDDADTVC